MSKILKHDWNVWWKSSVKINNCIAESGCSKHFMAGCCDSSVCESGRGRKQGALALITRLAALAAAATLPGNPEIPFCFSTRGWRKKRTRRAHQPLPYSAVWWADSCAKLDIMQEKVTRNSSSLAQLPREILLGWKSSPITLIWWRYHLVFYSI